MSFRVLPGPFRADNSPKEEAKVDELLVAGQECHVENFLDREGTFLRKCIFSPSGFVGGLQ
jgi:hypothetical protein